MSIQPHLCRFSYSQYLNRVRPAIQSILVGNWPTWVLQKYQLDLSHPSWFNRICARQEFTDCDCFTEDLIFQISTPCINYRQWSDLRLLRLFEKILLDECVINYICLPKRLIYLDRIWNEAFAEIGLTDPAFHTLLVCLCSRWTNTWIDCDNQGLGGYLTPEEVNQLYDYLNLALMPPPQHSIDSDYSEEDFDEFITALHSIEELAGCTVSGKDGLFWSHDLMSEYYEVFV